MHFRVNIFFFGLYHTRVHCYNTFMAMFLNVKTQCLGQTTQWGLITTYVFKCQCWSTPNDEVGLVTALYLNVYVGVTPHNGVLLQSICH